MIEYWSSLESTDFGECDGLKFRFKAETDLFEFAKKKTSPMSLSLSPNGELLGTTALDQCIRVFRFSSGKLLRSYDLSPDAIDQLHRSGDER